MSTINFKTASGSVKVIINDPNISKPQNYVKSGYEKNVSSAIVLLSGDPSEEKADVAHALPANNANRDKS